MVEPPEPTSMFRDIITKIDSYSVPVSLVYKNQRKIKSYFGGWVTIAHYLLILFWATLAIPKVVNPTWHVDEYTTDNIVNGECTPSYTFEPNFFIPTFTFVKEITYDPFWRYKIGAMYRQENYNDKGSPKYYGLIECKDSVYAQYMGNHINQTQTFCPDIGDDQIQFMTNTVDEISVQNDQLFGIEIRSCDNFQNQTGFNDTCWTNVTDDDINDVRVVGQTLYLIPNGDYTVSRNTAPPAYQARESAHHLVAGKAVLHRNILQPTNATYYSNAIANTIDTLDVVYLESVHTASADYSQDDFTYVYMWELGTIATTITYGREDFLGKLSEAGGIMAILTPFFSLLTLYQTEWELYNNYVLDTYSVTAESEAVKKPAGMTKSVIDSDVQWSNAEVDSWPEWTHPMKRTPFNYHGWQATKDCFRSTCCCRCCHGHLLPSKFQGRFALAKKEINREMDVMNIITQLRHHQFLLETLLKPHQLLITEFFKQYVITDHMCDSDHEDAATKAEKKCEKFYEEEAGEKSICEHEVHEQIDQVGKYAHKFGHKETKEFVAWCDLKLEQLRILYYMRVYDPMTRELDFACMKRVLGAPKDYDDKAEMKRMLLKLMENQMEQITETEKSYKFLKKVPGFVYGLHADAHSSGTLPVAQGEPGAINDDGDAEALLK